MPWWTMELRRVLQMIKSAHCTTTMETKKAVWHVYSSVFLSRYVCKPKRQLNPARCARHTHPFLSVRVLEIVDGLGIPLLSDAEEVGRSEAVLSHDDEVDEEAGGGLDHADLAVRHRDQPVRWTGELEGGRQNI